MTDIGYKIPGLAVPWVWIQPRTDDELIERLIQAREYNVHELERENLCSVAAGRLQRLIAISECAEDLSVCVDVYHKLAGGATTKGQLALDNFRALKELP